MNHQWQVIYTFLFLPSSSPLSFIIITPFMKSKVKFSKQKSCIISLINFHSLRLLQFKNLKLKFLWFKYIDIKLNMGWSEFFCFFSFLSNNLMSKLIRYKCRKMENLKLKFHPLQINIINRTTFAWQQIMFFLLI